MISKTLIAVDNSVGKTISFVCDNCKTNVAVCGKLGGPGERYIEAIDCDIFLVFDSAYTGCPKSNRTQILIKIRYQNQQTS